MGGAHPDGGVDLLIERSGVKTVAQCKQWRKWNVGVRHVREFLGTLTDSKISNGIFVTLQGYTEEARALAKKHNITLLALDDLLRLLEETDWQFNPDVQALLDDTRKFCPRCEKEMVLRTASKGSRAGRQFWGCSAYPRCRFVLNID
jgi:restriction system protein